MPGMTFKDKNTLLTGVSKGSIGVEILKGLLSGSAHVVITTSHYTLTVKPFNQGSKQDVKALIDYIYATLGMDLNYILPFATVPENGHKIDGLDNKLELAHCIIMLVNLLWILGAVKTKKASGQFVTQPTQVILPLSPNHSLFGNDDLYSESKISLETLFNCWNSESRGEYLCLAGAVIGMGLMDATNIVTWEVEVYSVHTFSTKKMAFNILHPLLFSITQVEPIWADLNGGIDCLLDLADITTHIQMDLNKKSELCCAIAHDNALDFKVINGAEGEHALQNVNVVPCANFKFDLPTLKPASAFEELSKSCSIINLEKVIIMTGFAKVSPWHSSQTQWEMEAHGEFTIEGCIDMAQIMGSIKHFDSHLKDSTLHVGWVDAKTGEPVADKDIRNQYEKEILSHAGNIVTEMNHFMFGNPNGATKSKTGVMEDLSVEINAAMAAMDATALSDNDTDEVAAADSNIHKSSSGLSTLDSVSIANVNVHINATSTPTPGMGNSTNSATANSNNVESSTGTTAWNKSSGLSQ
ncbi:hypothetical protein F5J12DRAFT_938715 [Pisolithus orientalis]|uniref:uncharacterized protein n=1 Tax=Pisolithus orientalis TaxID=936130 RepID=UPI0022245413|nr:uncharacterized protein F5J12DRAFT_938715 [Pisolithus orientalis]KAI6007741.1 hypothetical protein F5J12DRAFT_938715 [Pisolithus orientalis]